jgi:phosphoribosylformylglycinamidine synthase
MAASAVDEAMRNVVAVGADPRRIALLDNFCWGNTDRPEIFGSLVEAAYACRDVALEYGAPFISGKDSLNNEFVSDGERIVIPPTLLISALGIVDDVRMATTMDLKEPGNLLFIIGATKDELGGSQFNLVTGATGGGVPAVDTDLGKRVFFRVHEAISAGLVRSCHDLSEGGLAAGLAECAFAGGLGVKANLGQVPVDGPLSALTILFSESNSRFLIETAKENARTLLQTLADVPTGLLGEVVAEPILTIVDAAGKQILSESIEQLKQIWKAPLDW